MDTFLRRSCCDWLLTIVTNKGNAPIGFTITTMAVNIFTHSANVSIYPNHYQCKDSPPGSSNRVVYPRPDLILGQVPGNRGDHFLGGREINFGRVDRQVIVPGVKPVTAGKAQNIAAAIPVRALDHLNSLSFASRMIDVHDPPHPEPQRGVNHDIEKLYPATQQVESTAAENHAGPFDRQFGNEAALDLRQLFVGDPTQRRWHVEAVRCSHREDRNQLLPKAL